MRNKLDGTTVGQNLHRISIDDPTEWDVQDTLSTRATQSWYEEGWDFNSQHISPFK